MKDGNHRHTICCSKKFNLIQRFPGTDGCFSFEVRRFKDMFSSLSAVSLPHKGNIVPQKILKTWKMQKCENGGWYDGHKRLMYETHI